ncbi:Tim10/DDP family zinc finger-domain-containing protein [Roridomyces roridus]|uniref:Mitochondrial import inner membrane translocase subunit n=1 Tax=Roridomyces roridus TaxID=1738132 RepID=A0AAD7BU44_9AGAR|nr:Tim10/DDP family zinc finger-domain-containing protein [Roridomyces roridus]
MADKFDEATQKELGAFLEKQQTEARLHQSIHTFTGMCWDKCITGTPGARFSRSEESCLSNCVERFLDTSLFMVRRIEEQRHALEAASNGKFTE